ncbi:MAG: hypothetical protein SFW67_14755 [Myxococcaceae bacterium]|nr:hypothetical protein [Myxococcaceae bacterium]
MKTLVPRSSLGSPVFWTIVALDLVLLAWLVVVSQVRLEVTTTSPTPLGLTAGRARSFAVVEVAAPLDVTVTHESGGRLFVAPFVTGRRAALTDPSTYQPGPGFSVDGELPRGGRWKSDQPGSRLSWRGSVSGLTLSYASEQGPATVCVEATTTPRSCVTVEPGAPRTFHVSSGRWVQHALLPLWQGPFTVTGEVDSVVRIEAFHGVDELLVRSGPFVEAPIEAQVDVGARLRALGTLLVNALLLLAQAGAMVLVLVLLGAAVVTPIVDRLAPLEALLLCFFAGEGLATNIVSSVFHGAPLRGAWLALVGLASVALIAQLGVRKGWQRWRGLWGRLTASDLRLFSHLGAVAVASTLVFFYPAVLFPGWYEGHVYTDAVDYPAWASVAFDAPLDWGLGAIRYQDYLRLGITALSSGVDTTTAMTSGAVRLWLLFPFLAFAVFLRLGLTPRAALAGAAAASHGTLLFQLFSQGYVPQYEVAHLVIAGAWAALWFSDFRFEAVKGAGRWFAELSLACVFAASVGLYPYQAFSVMAFGLVWLAAAIARRSRSDLTTLARVVAAVVLLVNVNLDVVVDFNRGSMQHRAALNALAHHTVFPWHAGPEAPALLAGLDDLVRHSERAQGFEAELFAAMPRTGQRFVLIVESLQRLRSPAATLFWCLALVFSLALLGRASRGPLVLFVTLALAAGMVALLAARDDLYFWIKSLMSLTSLAFLLVGGGLGAAASAAAWRSTRLGAGVALAALLLLGGRTLWFDHLGHLVSRKSEVLATARTHLSSHDEAMWRFQRWSQALPPGSTVAFAGRLHDRYRTDGDMVVYNKVLAHLQGHTVIWGPNVTQRYSRLREMEAPVMTRADWYLSFDPCPAPLTDEAHVSGWCVSRVDPRTAQDR